MITTVIHEESKLQEVLDLYRYLHPKDPQLEVTMKIENFWKNILENPYLFYIGTEIDEKLVATCNIAIVPNLTRGARPYGVIENLVVHPDHRRKGIGTQLLKFAISIAWKRNCYKVMLLTSRKDDAILQFYEKAGFERGVKTGFVKYNL
jgi:GNAT superfamily N-acetyltransferase